MFPRGSVSQMEAQLDAACKDMEAAVAEWSAAVDALDRVKWYRPRKLREAIQRAADAEQAVGRLTAYQDSLFARLESAYRG